MDNGSTHRKNRVVVWEGLPNISGGQRVALNLVCQLKERFDFTFIVPAKGQLSSALNEMQLTGNYVPVGNYQRGGKGILDIIQFLCFTPAALFMSYRVIKNNDLIYANSTKVFVWSAIMGSVMNIPVIWHLHNLLIDKKSILLLRIFGRLRSVKQIIAVSKAAADHMDLPGQKCEVVYNGVNIDTFRMQHSDRDVPAKKIAVIGDLLPQKGHRTVIKAIHRIKDHLPVELSIVGASIESSAYEGELKALVRELCLEDNVTFAGYRTDIPEILNSLDLLVIPSSSFEACPMVALEAFAAGVPVIGSDLGGTPELIDEGRTGYLFRAENDQDLAEKISVLFSNHELLKQMRFNCRKKAEEQFDLTKSARKIEMIINSIIRKQGA